MKNFNITSIRKFLGFIFLTFFFAFTSCKSPNDVIDSNNELKSTINSYASQGGTFKFRIQRFETGMTNNYNNQIAETYRLLEENGKVVAIGQTTVPTIHEQGYFGLIYDSDGNKIAMGSGLITSGNYNDDFEIMPNNDLISYHYYYGSPGGVEASYVNHTQSTDNTVFSGWNNAGYLYQINNQFFLLSMGANSNYGHPMIYKYDASTIKWTGTSVESMDYVQGSTTNLPTVNHASKVGNNDKVYWAYLNYDGTRANGKINILSYDGTNFSTRYTLPIGVIGEGSNIYNMSGIKLYKNPDNTNQPYMVVRRYNEDILDIYKFTGSAIQIVKTGVNIPKDTNGAVNYRYLCFTGNNVYMITGTDSILYKLNGTSFTSVSTSLINNNQLTAIESIKGGLLLALTVRVESTPEPKTVSDIVQISN